VRRDFTTNATAINARWCGDITYVPTWEGWLYLATVIDIASRRVVGWATADHLRTELVADALSNAIAARDPQTAGSTSKTSDSGSPASLQRTSERSAHTPQCGLRAPASAQILPHETPAAQRTREPTRQAKIN
jgi:transposase InsO family protein